MEQERALMEFKALLDAGDKKDMVEFVRRLVQRQLCLEAKLRQAVLAWKMCEGEKQALHGQVMHFAQLLGG